MIEAKVAQPKPFNIPKRIVWEAFKHVKENKGSGGIDEQSILEFEENLAGNLYKLWNRMSSGSYFPKPVKAVSIPKKNGGERILGIPTVCDRVAQMVVKQTIEPNIDPIFHNDSYGYRPGKSAIQAVGVVRERCWKYNWVLEFDIKGLFDNIDHQLLMKAVRHHVKEKWAILYIERWIKAPMIDQDGKEISRNRGVPQGGVISPLLANLFLHYAFDRWMSKHYPGIPIVRYADDGVAHCRTKEESLQLLKALKERFLEVGLELHEEKTRIIYCKDDDRKGKDEENTSFDFLGFTFRPRRSKNWRGKFFINFTPGVSQKACKAMRDTTRRWKLRMRSDKSLQELAKMYNPVVRGSINYYGKYYKSAIYDVLRHLNSALEKWACRTLKRFKGHRRQARHWLGKIAQQKPNLFAHWQFVRPEVGG
jgi:RNA-directed DNA polymerase